MPDKSEYHVPYRIFSFFISFKRVQGSEEQTFLRPTATEWCTEVGFIRSPITGNLDMLYLYRFTHWESITKRHFIL
jgi:hypothetical protein